MAIEDCQSTCKGLLASEEVANDCRAIHVLAAPTAASECSGNDR